MQALIGKVVLGSRHLLTVFFVGLAAALGLYAIRFLWKIGKYAGSILTMDDNEALLGLLYLLDSALVATLVIMVAVASYDSLVARLSQDAKDEGMEWVGSIDPGNLKIKLAVAIVAISSIHLLQMFFKVETYSDRSILWALAIHGMFLLGIVALAVMDRLEGFGKAAKAEAKRIGAQQGAASPPGGAA
jgi:uncharacterized protein (TIGR00645 family)